MENFKISPRWRPKIKKKTSDRDDRQLKSILKKNHNKMLDSWAKNEKKKELKFLHRITLRRLHKFKTEFRLPKTTCFMAAKQKYIRLNWYKL